MGRNVPCVVSSALTVANCGSIFCRRLLQIWLDFAHKPGAKYLEKAVNSIEPHIQKTGPSPQTPPQKTGTHIWKAGDQLPAVVALNTGPQFRSFP